MALLRVISRQLLVTYDFDLSLRLLSDEKWIEVMSSPGLQKALLMVRQAKAQSAAEHN